MAAVAGLAGVGVLLSATLRLVAGSCRYAHTMKLLLTFLLWTLLLVLCWPLALLVLVLWPLLYLLSIPFRIVGAVLEGLLALVRSLLLLPARLLGGR